jgi:excinuclease UvrABC ATPase subunit
MKTCPHCYGSRLKKESLHCFLCLDTSKIDKKTQSEIPVSELFVNSDELPFAKPEDDHLLKFNIYDLQKMELDHLIQFLELLKKTNTKPVNLLERILTPLLDRAKTIQDLGL